MTIRLCPKKKKLNFCLGMQSNLLGNISTPVINWYIYKSMYYIRNAKLECIAWSRTNIISTAFLQTTINWTDFSLYCARVVRII